MMSEGLEETKISLIRAGGFFDHDLCQLLTEVSYDIVYHGNPDYIKKSINAMQIIDLIWPIMSNEAFKNHPLRRFFDKKNIPFDKKYWLKEIHKSYKELPGFSFFEIKRDDKRSTIFFEIKFYAVIDQLKNIPEELLTPWLIEVRTPFGSTVIN